MIKEIIINKIDEVRHEYKIILENNSNDIDYIDICTHQKNSMIIVLNEVLSETLILTKSISKKYEDEIIKLTYDRDNEVDEDMVHTYNCLINKVKEFIIDLNISDKQ